MMKKRKVFTHPPVAMERLRDTHTDLILRLVFLIVMACLGVTGLVYFVATAIKVSFH